MLPRLRAIAFWVGFAGSTIVFGLLVAPLALPFGWHGRYRALSQWTRFNVWWLGVTCGLRHRVYGAANLLQPTPAIVMAKHQSAWETIALQQILPPQVWVLKRELMRIPFFGWAIGMVDPVPVDRKAGRRALDALVEAGTDRLRRGLWVVLFPEGTRVAPGERGRYRIGGAVLAARSGYPVIPIAHNSGSFWPRRSLVKHPGVIDVVVGPPIASEGREPEAILAKVENWIESEVARLERRA
ncbi:lysophospholipid acyltransferase family protein [Thioalkalivibrio nitratireducens]|nr:lysophospholipid acyltransferase family protein [Thioalkalivibrio nitratireducens]